MASRVSPNFLVELEEFARRFVAGEARPITTTSKEWPSIEALGEALDKATSGARRHAAELMEEHLRVNSRSPLVGSVSVFAALGHCRYEVAHTQALGWLLDPRGSHGFGARLIEAFLTAIEPNEYVDVRMLEAVRGISEDAQGDGEEASLRRVPWRARVSTEHYLSPRCRADVLIEGTNPIGDRWTIVVEAKVEAKERPSQLRDLLECAPNQHKFGVFLTTDGACGTTADEGWVSLTYKQWARALIKSFPSLMGFPGAEFLRIYITGVLMDVCEIRCGRSPEETLRYNSPFEIEMLLGE